MQINNYYLLPKYYFIKYKLINEIDIRMDNLCIYTLGKFFIYHRFLIA